jgi:hypothetical protein
VVFEEKDGKHVRLSDGGDVAAVERIVVHHSTSFKLSVVANNQITLSRSQRTQ